uniref:Uncharacterized protein n=1 Tax=Heterorhabditis bacteriophora TaxID=37862 RepID=A0A1I7W9Q6_HETBA
MFNQVYCFIYIITKVKYDVYNFRNKFLVLYISILPFNNYFCILRLLQLLIALCYDSDHGCVTVGIERGSSFGEKSRPPGIHD